MSRTRAFCPSAILIAGLLLGLTATAVAGEAKVEIGEKGEMRVAGKPFFPILVWAQPKSLVAYHAGLGMNAMNPGESVAKEGPRLALLDEVQKHGMRLFLHTTEYTPEIAAHPALLAWMHGDEPDMAEAAQYEVDAEKLPAGGHVLIEAENAAQHNFNTGSWLNAENAAFSGRKWLGVDAAKLPEQPFQAAYAFTAPKEAEYNLFAREFDKRWACPTTWRIDGGEWKTTDRALVSADKQKAMKNAAVGWVGYGKVKLTAGKHTLEIQVKEPRTAGKPDKTSDTILGAYDLFLFTTADTHPPAKANEPVPRHDPGPLKTAYLEMRQKDPNHPIWLNLTGGFFTPYRKLDLKWYRAFGEAADCVSYDHYPVTGWNQPGKVPELAAATKEFLALYPKKACWVIVEASDQDLSWTPKETRGPTAKEMRAEVWMAVTAGAKGIGYFTVAFQPFRWKNLTPEIEAELKRTNGQLTELAPAILSYDEGPNVAGSTDQVQFLVRRHEGATYLFAVSLDVKGEQTAEFAFPAGFAATTAEAIGEGRTVALAGGKLKDRFAPLEVHLYRIKP